MSTLTSDPVAVFLDGMPDGSSRTFIAAGNSISNAGQGVNARGEALDAARGRLWNALRKQGRVEEVRAVARRAGRATLDRHPENTGSIAKVVTAAAEALAFAALLDADDFAALTDPAGRLGIADAAHLVQIGGAA